MTHDLEETYRSLLQSAEKVLLPEGWLVFEIGFGQKDRIQAIVADNLHFRIHEIRNDAQSIPRVFVLQLYGR
jgi:methylase of polypeptide subunit release factors